MTAKRSLITAAARASPHADPRTPHHTTPGPDANALELFARIAAAGSFAQAARELGLTRAAVSRRVAHIEAQLGAPLFARSTRALGLSEAGRRLAPRARAVLEAAESARRGLRARAGDGLAGTLRITSVPSFGQAVLGPWLARFQALHPGLRIELRFTNRRVDLLREDVDIAFRLTDKPPADCVATPVLPFVVRAYAAPAAACSSPPTTAWPTTWRAACWCRPCPAGSCRCPRAARCRR